MERLLDGAFIRDPDGNSVEAVHHADVRRGGHIDHLWLRVADLDAAAAFTGPPRHMSGFAGPAARLCPPDSYAAGVLDPAGVNVESVFRESR